MLQFIVGLVIGIIATVGSYKQEKEVTEILKITVK
jgi:hypothetical protein